MALRNPARATVPPEANILKFDDAPEFMDGSMVDAPLEDMDAQVKEAQQRLTSLRAQQEEVERQKQLLESLRQKQERFVSGKKDVVDKLDRSLRAVAEDLDEARLRVENLTITQQDFQEHLKELKDFLPERWHRSQLDHELDKALAALDDAEVGYEKGVRRLSSNRQMDTSSFHHVSANDEESSSSRGFMSMSFGSHHDDLTTWMRRGFAFTLPLIVALIVSLILVKLMF
jgi:hypothetical protein